MSSFAENALDWRFEVRPNISIPIKLEGLQVQRLEEDVDRLLQEIYLYHIERKLEIETLEKWVSTETTTRR